MKCSARVLREKKVYKITGEKILGGIQIYCPLLGEIVLDGKRAEAFYEKLKEREVSKSEEE